MARRAKDEGPATAVALRSDDDAEFMSDMFWRTVFKVAVAIEMVVMARKAKSYELKGAG